MLITDKNFETQFLNQRRIAIPRGEVAFTFFVHSLVLFICHLLCYKVLVIVAMCIFALEVFNGIRIMFKIWIKLGYSIILFFIFQIIYFVACYFLAGVVRDFIINSI